MDLGGTVPCPHSRYLTPCTAGGRERRINLKLALAERLTAHYAPARERYQELLALPHEINNILGDGAQRLLPLVTETMREVKERVGLA
jgi:hypothetical protein